MAPAVESLRKKDQEFKASSLEGKAGREGRRRKSYLLEKKVKSTNFSLVKRVIFSYLTMEVLFFTLVC